MNRLPIVLILAFTCCSVFAEGWKDFMPVRSLTMQQNGMKPSYEKGTRLFVKSGFLYSSDDIKRGHVVSFYKEINGNTYIYLWRAIALPGDSLVTEGDSVTLNGKKLRREKSREYEDENIQYEYIEDKSYLISLEGDASKHKLINVVIPDGFIFVMGDNRNHASDSRYMGLIPIDSVFGVQFP